VVKSIEYFKTKRDRKKEREEKREKKRTSNFKN